MKKQVKIGISVLVVLAVISYGAFTLFTPLTVSVEELKSGPLEDSFSDEGQIVALNEWQIFSGFSGTVSDVYYREGDLVKAGDPIVAIDSDELLSKKQLLLQLKIQLNQVVAEEKSVYGNGSVPVALTEAKRAYDTAKKAYQDAQVLYEAGGISDNDLKTAENAYQSAQSALSVAQAQAGANSKDYYANMKASLNQQIAALEKSVGQDDTQESDGQLLILAPYGGRVGRLEVEKGQPVTAYAAIASVYTPDSYEVETYPLAADAVKLQTGDPVTLKVGGSGEEYRGRIKSMASQAVSIVSSLGLSESRLKVTVEPESLPAGFGPGFTLEVFFKPVVAEDVLTAPAEALLPYQDGDAVYLVREGKAVIRPVSVGRKANGRVAIEEGLEAGDVIIVDSQAAGLKEGARVKY